MAASPPNNPPLTNARRDIRSASWSKASGSRDLFDDDTDEQSRCEEETIPEVKLGSEADGAIERRQIACPADHLQDRSRGRSQHEGEQNGTVGRPENSHEHREAKPESEKQIHFANRSAPPEQMGQCRFARRPIAVEIANVVRMQNRRDE